MNFIEVATIATFIISVVITTTLVVIVYKHNPKSATNRTFVGLGLATIVWSIAMNFSFLQDVILPTLWWIRLSISLAVLQTILILLLAVTIPKAKISISRNLLFAGSVITVGLMVLMLSPYSFSKIIDYQNNLANPQPGWGFIVFNIYAISVLVTSIIVLTKKYRIASGHLKKQYLWILVGIVATYSLIILTIALPTLLFQFNLFVRFHFVYLLILLFTFAFAITRHRLFDIRVIIQSKYIRATITLLAFLIVFAVAYMVMNLTNNLWLFMLVALLGTLAVQFWLNRVFQRYLNQSIYDLSLPPELKLLDNTQAAVDKVFELVQQHLQTEFGARGTVAFMYDWLDKRYRSLNTEKPLLISERHALVRVMNTATNVITRTQLEQADTMIAPAERDELLRFFHKHGYVMVLPLYNPVMIYGFVAITHIVESASNSIDPAMGEKLLNLGQKYGYYLGQVLTYEALVRQGREQGREGE